MGCNEILGASYLIFFVVVPFFFLLTDLDLRFTPLWIYVLINATAPLPLALLYRCIEWWTEGRFVIAQLLSTFIISIYGGIICFLSSYYGSVNEVNRFYVTSRYSFVDGNTS